MRRAVDVMPMGHPKAPKRREKDIQTAILSLLHARGVVCWKAGSGGFRVKDTHGRERYVKMGATGVADIIGVVRGWHSETGADGAGRSYGYVCGRFFAIEVKAPNKHATPEQENFLASVRQAGGLAFVAHSVDEVAREMGWT